MINCWGLLRCRGEKNTTWWFKSMGLYCNRKSLAARPLNVYPFSLKGKEVYIVWTLSSFKDHVRLCGCNLVLAFLRSLWGQIWHQYIYLWNTHVHLYVTDLSTVSVRNRIQKDDNDNGCYVWVTLYSHMTYLEKYVWLILCEPVKSNYPFRVIKEGFTLFLGMHACFC